MAGNEELDELPFVSVVVATRNRAHMLLEALASLLEQDYPPDRYEILVVDDGSTDGTATAVEGLAEARSQPHLRVVRQAARNQNAARNHGVSKAKGELIAFFDDDELAPVNWLSGLVAGCRRHPDANVVGGPYRLRLEAPAPRLCDRCWSEEAATSSFSLGDEEEDDAEQAAGGNMLVRRRAFEQFGLFDESLEGLRNETEWMIRHRKAGGRIAYLPDVPIWHRRGAADLRLMRRLRRFHTMGRSLARFDQKLGRPVPVVTHIAFVPRLLGHAVRRGCSGGLTQASRSLGYATEATRQAIGR